jgi:hypothetical protein
MTSFAERMGKRQTRSLIQREELDVETRTALWNVFVVLRDVLHDVHLESFTRDQTEARVLMALWALEYKRARDEMRDEAQVWGMIKNSVFEAPWYDVLDLIEATTKYLERCKSQETRTMHTQFAEVFNDQFEKYLVGYRFIGEEVTPVDSTAEAEALVGAQDDASGIAGARHALERATELLADRQNPDYANSIKESISAVEAVVQKVTGEGTLGNGLKRLESAGLALHPALKGAWSQMYGWTSDADGIRHAGTEAAAVDQAMAKYFLVVCSAFVSYLTEEGRKNGLLA